MRRARSFGIALFFILSACKKQEPVQQVAPTETGTIAASTVASAVPEPSASAAETSPAAPSASVIAPPSASATKGLLQLTGNQEGHAPEDSFLRGHQVHTPSVRIGTTTMTGRLPPEVVHRIVRRNLAAIRACYEDGLRKKPDLQGRVTTKFVIGSDGNVTTAQDGGSDLPDPSVVQCVVKKFGTLAFPSPEDGIVTVVFPLVFAPSE